jgi:hypothetical protein
MDGPLRWENWEEFEAIRRRFDEEQRQEAQERAGAFSPHASPSPFVARQTRRAGFVRVRYWFLRRMVGWFRRG